MRLAHRWRNRRRRNTCPECRIIWSGWHLLCPDCLGLLRKEPR